MVATIRNKTHSYSIRSRNKLPHCVFYDPVSVFLDVYIQYKRHSMFSLMTVVSRKVVSG